MENMKLGKMDKLNVHFVGNKNNGEGVNFSNTLTKFDTIEEELSNLLTSNFKSDELFHFYFSPDLELNPMYKFVSSIFSDNSAFIDQSQNCSRYLYDKSTHPNIKAGELIIIYYKDCLLNGEKSDAIGIFKSENKDTILKVFSTNDGYNLEKEKGINTNKLDKGCIVFNLEKENGFLVSIVDNTNRNNEAQYWKDDFLSLKPVEDKYHHTNQFLSITKQYVTKQISEDFDINKADQIDLLNRSVEYFKTHESFNKSDFENEVFQDKDLINSFRSFDDKYRNENEVELLDDFEISTQAVKKQARVFKSVLKLDKNFHIYIHGDRELIEQGIEKDGRKYYKIYYEDES